MEKTNNQGCFISTLMRLKMSSRDAVVSPQFIDEYSLYMHVDRPVQKAFEAQLKKSAASGHAELILLCGSVGDGKSHMLLYYCNKYPELMEKFVIHNDSTASFYTTESAEFTLKEVLADFADDRLESTSSKMIIAINLGTLSKFLNKDTEGKFTKLAEYVEKAGILDETMYAEEHEYFHSINFADYHLYELTQDGPRAEYISALIEKITKKDPANIFYDSYCRNCKGCESSSCCPIRINYDLLSDAKIQQGLVSAVIESIVKHKLIVSTRELLDFFYEILVDERCFDSGSCEPRKEAQKMTQIQYCNALLPCTLFGRQDASEILKAMHSIDPLRIRNERVDDFFVFYNNSEEVISVFHDDLGEYEYTIHRIRDINFADPQTHFLKEELLYLFIRLCWLAGRRKDLLLPDENYHEFMRCLYLWNTGRYIQLKQLYSDVEKGILSWNGTAGKNEMQLPVTNNHSSYYLYQDIEMKIVTDNMPRSDSEVLYSFKDELRLKYRVRHKDIIGELDVDYNLYVLLKRILNGYVPNVNDKRVNVKCVEFIRKMSQGGSKMELLKIRDFSQIMPKEYRFEYDEEFGYSFEEI